MSLANTLFCCSHISSRWKTEEKEETDRWGNVALHPNQCNRRSYQTASQSGGREADREAERRSVHTSVWPPPSRHIFSSLPLSFLRCWWAARLLCLQGYLKATPPGGISGGLQGPALIARRHCSQSRIPRAKHIDALIRPSISSFCPAKHNLWLPDKSVRNNRRLNIYKGTCRAFSSFLSHLVPKNFILTLKISRQNSCAFILSHKINFSQSKEFCVYGVTSELNTLVCEWVTGDPPRAYSCPSPGNYWPWNGLSGKNGMLI